jgi:hypothetical protein
VFKTWCLLLLTASLALTAACGSGSEKQVGGPPYSAAFTNWIYRSLPITIELGNLQNLEPANNDAGARAKLQELAQRQFDLDLQYSGAAPPAMWRSFHERIVGAMTDFGNATAIVRNADPSRALDSLIDLFDREQRALTQRVVSCYGQGSTCR